MTVLTLLRTELRRLTATRLGPLAFIALMTVPLLYGGMYLWGNQNPYAKLDHIPAAMVVTDTGATVHGYAVDSGQEVGEAAGRRTRVRLAEMSVSAAAAQLRTGGVDFVVTLPRRSPPTSPRRPPPTRRAPASSSRRTTQRLPRLDDRRPGRHRHPGRGRAEVGAAAAKQFLVGLATVG